MAGEMDENDVNVTLPDEENVEVRVGDDKNVDDREAALLEMKNQLAEVKKREEMERIARQRAEQYAYQQAQNAQHHQNTAQSNQLRVIVNAMDATEQAALNAERTLKDAMASGDYDLAAKAQRAIAAAEAQMAQLERGKTELEYHLKVAEGRVNEPQQPQFAPQQPQDPVEALASRLTPKSADWLRAHPEAAHKVNKLTAAHQAAVELEGIAPESPEYFAYIEKSLGMASKGRKAMASAPVSSSSSMSSTQQSGYSGGTTMRLSAAEVEQALLNDPELPREKAIENYARAKAALIREGKMHA